MCSGCEGKALKGGKSQGCRQYEIELSRYEEEKSPERMRKPERASRPEGGRLWSYAAS
jgi:hypothetical protein